MRIMTLLLAVCLASGTTAAWAALPSFLTFGKEKSATTTRHARGNSTFKTPAVLTKMTSSTKRLVTNTKSLLVPKKASEPPKLGAVRVNQAAKYHPPEQGFWERFFNPQPAPPPRTMAEWMALDHPRP